MSLFTLTHLNLYAYSFVSITYEGFPYLQFHQHYSYLMRFP